MLAHMVKRYECFGSFFSKIPETHLMNANGAACCVHYEAVSDQHSYANYKSTLAYRLI